MTTHLVGAFSIAGLSTACLILRPGGLPEYVFALAGAACLVLFGFLPAHLAGAAILKGTDVYLFLTGMLLLSEIARLAGLFDWTAARAVAQAKGSASRLFMLIYGVGVIITVFLSNDATAVVLTPAVYAAARAAKVEPLPYLYICAFIANAASFVLPISNPANLVMFGAHMPPLLKWLGIFALPSLAAIVATFLVLRWTQRESLRAEVTGEPDEAPLSTTGKLSAAGLALTAVALLISSALGLDLGAPTFICALLVTGLILAKTRQSPGVVIKDISWGVLPMVAGLFVLAEGLSHVGLIDMLAQPLRSYTTAAPKEAVFGVGVLTALLANIVNNLPLGLIASSVGQTASSPVDIIAAMMIGVDLGPNLSVTGSLATLLWMASIRREGAEVSGWRFFKLGMLVMPPALICSLLALLAR